MGEVVAGRAAPFGCGNLPFRAIKMFRVFPFEENDSSESLGRCVVDVMRRDLACRLH